MSKEIGKKLKQLRIGKKLTQQELADKIKITRATISNYEIGRRTPHLRDLQKFAEAFGVGLDYFGVQETDEAFSLLTKAQAVFKSPNIQHDVKVELHREFMKLYLQL